MPTIITIQKVAIRVYTNDHPPAHFHLVSPTFTAKIAIDGLEIIASSTATRNLRPALKWAAQNIDTIRAAWDRYHGD